MTVPTKMSDLNSTIGSNSPAGTDIIGTTLDDYIRAAYGILKQNASRGTDIISSSSITIPDDGSYFIVTGTITISSIADAWNGRLVALKFSDALQLTHSSGLILPGSANITTVAGDVGVFVNESTGIWRCIVWTSASALISDKADKVSGATAGNIATLDASGNLLDSGTSTSSLVSGKADKVTGATSGNLATLDASGNLQDSGIADSGVLETSNIGVTVQGYDVANGAFGNQLLHVQDQKPSGTAGGTSLVGNNIRDLNTILTNEIGASLASNQITLPAGTYYIDANAPAQRCGTHRLSLFNVTDSSIVLIGSSAYEANSIYAQTRSWCIGRFSLITTTSLELHHLIATSYATYGLGVQISDGSNAEIYTDLKIWKLS